MKISMLFTLPLAAALALPAVAQQTAPSGQQPAASSTQSTSQTAESSSQSMPNEGPDQNLSAMQPLQPQTREGFWGKLNPFARKKYVQRQVTPIRDRVNELDDLTAENARQIKDVDARAQEGIRQADAKATLADQHAVDAANRAEQANQMATEANNHLNTVEQVVGNIDQYKPATVTEIRYRSGQTVLSRKDRSALDDMTANLQNQKGYIIQVQGFSASAGPAGVRSSQAMANAVVRYLVEKNDIPVYRIYVMGMGNARLPAEDGETSRVHGNRVEISLLKNGVDQLASMSQPEVTTASTPATSTATTGMATTSSTTTSSPAATNTAQPRQSQSTSYLAQPAQAQPAQTQPAGNSTNPPPQQ
ncbi:MAG TPA: OmpA family protein [Terriglobales bacterium]|nr:OmpA family protein [Terriglobales bacterium]